jgi:hypothetical protein
MLFPVHMIPEAAMKVQVGFAASLVGVAWLVAGLFLERLAWAGRVGRLRAFAGRNEWRWLGVLLVLGGLCLARPWGMDASPWVWMRHSALLLAVLAAGALATAGRARDPWASVSLVVLVVLHFALLSWAVVRLSGADLPNVLWLGHTFLPDAALLAVMAGGLAALGVGLVRVLRAPLRAGALHALALVVMLPVFSESLVVTLAVDRKCRQALHFAAMEWGFGREPVPAGLHFPDGAACGEGAGAQPEPDPCACGN